MTPAATRGAALDMALIDDPDPSRLALPVLEEGGGGGMGMPRE